MIYDETKILDQLAQKISDKIDAHILTISRAEAILAKEKQDASLRDEYPSLMAAWEEYQVKLRLISAAQSSH